MAITTSPKIYNRGTVNQATGARLVTPIDSAGAEVLNRSTYSASITALAPAASATDIFTIIGSATKTVRITRIQISGVATAAGTFDVVLVKRSTADSGGTSTSPTIVPHDSSDSAATAVVKAYTVNPTLGTLVGNLQARSITLTTAATPAIPNILQEFLFELRGEKAIVLRGVAQQLAINLNAQTITGGLLDISISFTEE